MAEALEVMSVEDSRVMDVSLNNISTEGVQSTSRSWTRRLLLAVVPVLGLAVVAAAVSQGPTIFRVGTPSLRAGSLKGVDDPPTYDEAVAKQRQASQRIRAATVGLRAATCQSFEALKKELENVMVEELPHAAAGERATLCFDGEQALEIAQQNVDEEIRMRRAVAETERKRREMTSPLGSHDEVWSHCRLPAGGATAPGAGVVPFPTSPGGATAPGAGERPPPPPYDEVWSHSRRPQGEQQPQKQVWSHSRLPQEEQQPQDQADLDHKILSAEEAVQGRDFQTRQCGLLTLLDYAQKGVMPLNMDLIREQMNSDIEKIRERTLELLAYSGGTADLEMIRDAVRKDSFPVKAEAAFALGKLAGPSNPEDFDLVLPFYLSAPPMQRKNFVQALGMLATPGCEEQLQIFRDAVVCRDVMVLPDALFALGDLADVGSSKDLEVIRAATEFPGSRVRENAFIALGKVSDGCPDDLSTILKGINDQRSKDVQNAATTALDRVWNLSE